MKKADKPRLIAVEGLLKSQNTALAKALAQSGKGETILEAAAITPFIDFSSSDPDDLSFKRHLLHLIDRFRVQKGMKQTDMFGETCVSDYLFFADRVYATLKLRPDEKILYDVLMTHMETQVVVPDVVVYLQTSVDHVLESLTTSYGKRQLFDVDYIRALNDEFNEFFLYYRWSPVLIINAQQMNPDKPEHVAELFQKLQRPFAGVIYYNPPVAL